MYKSDAFEFLERLAKAMPEEERLILCGFTGDPDKAEPSDWRPRPWRLGEKSLPFGPRSNGYVTVSSFGRAEDKSYRRRQSTFAAGRALMIDDVGTKVEKSMIDPLAPSALIETSPGNYQAWYFLSAPERDQQKFDGVIRAFIKGKLLGADPGMSGVTRVGRLPGFANAKPKYGGFTTRLEKLTNKRYSIAELLAAFDLKIEGRAAPTRKIPKDVAISRVRAFDAAFDFLQRNDMLKRETPDLSGWTEMTCPWVDDHTNSANTGAAIREPMPENQYYGAFRCHHGHCIDKGWPELQDFILEHAGDRLATINAAAPLTLAAMRRGK